MTPAKSERQLDQIETLRAVLLQCTCARCKQPILGPADMKRTIKRRALCDGCLAIVTSECRAASALERDTEKLEAALIVPNFSLPVPLIGLGVVLTLAALLATLVGFPVVCFWACVLWLVVACFYG